MSYIQQVQILSDDFFSSYGRKPSMYIKTFGCQMNDRESEKLQGLLIAMGYQKSSNEDEADLVLYNTCCVRESAENKVYGRLGRLKTIKAKQPGKVIVLCGCMPQRVEVMAELNRFHKHLDIVFGTYNKHHFPRLLHEHLTHRKPVIEILQDHAKDDSSFFDSQTTRSLAHKASVTIMHGCNNYCSYCIVPYVRGREVSRTPAEILTEIEILADDGVKEIILLGQNVNSYSYGFSDLIKKVNAVPKLKRIRFMTSHPKDMSQELIDAIGSCEKVSKHVHLPVQSGSSRILASMNRGYNKEEYLQLINRLRERVPDVAITTDIIVAFPGETEEDFRDTLDAVTKAKFAGAYTFIYSPREGTPAADLTDEIPKETAHERFNRLLDVVNPIVLDYNSQCLGRKVEVMVDEVVVDEIVLDSNKKGRFTGRTDDNILVHFELGDEAGDEVGNGVGNKVGNKAGNEVEDEVVDEVGHKGDNSKIPKPGDIVLVEITECKTFYMKGRI